MKRYRGETVLAVALAVAYACLWHWQAPGRPLTTVEVDAYISRIDAGMSLPDDEKKAVLAHLRAWGEADDGRPVFMLNLMRYYETTKPVPGRPEITGSPAELNAYYESVAIPLLLESGAYPMFAGTPQGTVAGTSTNLIGFEPELENWSRVLLVRYPDRRRFFDLLSDPAYVPVMPYKLAALAVTLTPLNPEVQVPDLRLTGGLAMAVLFFCFAWLKAARARVAR